MIEIENSRFVRVCEEIVFNNRAFYVAAFFVCTVIFGYYAAHLKMDSSL